MSHNNFPVFRGMRNQAGHGLGSIFGKLFRAFRPYIASGGKYVAKKSLHTGIDIANSLLDGENPRSAFKKGLNKMKTDIKRDVKTKLKNVMRGRGRPKVKGIKKKSSTTTRKTKSAVQKNKKSVKTRRKIKSQIHNHGDLF